MVTLAQLYHYAKCIWRVMYSYDVGVFIYTGDKGVYLVYPYTEVHDDVPPYMDTRVLFPKFVFVGGLTQDGQRGADGGIEARSLEDDIRTCVHRTTMGGMDMEEQKGLGYGTPIQGGQSSPLIIAGIYFHLTLARVCAEGSHRRRMQTSRAYAGWSAVWYSTIPGTPTGLLATRETRTCPSGLFQFLVVVERVGTGLAYGKRKRRSASLSVGSWRRCQMDALTVGWQAGVGLGMAVVMAAERHDLTESQKRKDGHAIVHLTPVAERLVNNHLYIVYTAQTHAASANSLGILPNVSHSAVKTIRSAPAFGSSDGAAHPRSLTVLRRRQPCEAVAVDASSLFPVHPLRRAVGFEHGKLWFHSYGTAVRLRSGMPLTWSARLRNTERWMRDEEVGAGVESPPCVGRHTLPRRLCWALFNERASRQNNGSTYRSSSAEGLEHQMQRGWRPRNGRMEWMDGGGMGWTYEVCKATRPPARFSGDAHDRMGTKTCQQRTGALVVLAMPSSGLSPKAKTSAASMGSMYRLRCAKQRSLIRRRLCRPQDPRGAESLAIVSSAAMRMRGAYGVGSG
ncbi:hypothetical protein HYPSUDRAFT_58267 [Hypholoma sublateritium FD-334 SS-4]|uniref:Uncharacterized protein n=1 Tax=Hypholoma sublateritium (strain FD-334 SS-4) TaxID=945553 RepID=A0A0D2NI78_HYPSF|nr:hypothetical protein HYPSUDRAFT_58267 [Hypholoma sublateritium FD-334 SS-4]